MANKKNIGNILQKIDKNRYELFILDFDGTLVESLKVDWLGLKKELCRLIGIDFREGLRVSNLLDEIKRARGSRSLREAYEIVSRYESEAIEEARVRKEMGAFIRDVLNKGKKVAIFSTNMRKTIDTILTKFKLRDKFSLVVSKEDVNRYKPDPEGLRLILSRLEVPSSKALFLGDKDVDLDSGRKAKVETVLVS